MLWKRAQARQHTWLLAVTMKAEEGAKPKSEVTAADLTEMMLLCRAIAADGRQAKHLHRLLRWFGCRGSTQGLARHLDFLVRLGPAFRRVASLYSGLAAPCDMLLTAGHLSGELNRLRSTASETGAAPDLLEAVDAAFAEPAVQNPLAVWPADLEPGGAQQLMWAASYALNRVWTGHLPAAPDCLRALITFSAGQDLGALLTPSDPLGQTSLEHLSPVEICTDLAQRAERGELKALQDSEPTWPVETVEFLDFMTLLAWTDARDPYTPLRVDPRKWKPKPLAEAAPPNPKSIREWGNRGSQMLLDRELLEEAIYGLNQTEASTLAALFASAPRPSNDGILTRKELLAEVGGFVAQLGALTASSIGQAAFIPVRVQADPVGEGPQSTSAGGRQLHVKRGAGRMPDAVHWWPTRTEGSEFSVQIEDLELDLCSFQKNFTLDELLPLPISEIRQEVLKHIGDKLGRSPHQADLCVKHLLARQIFTSTANRGIVAHLCTTWRPADKQSGDSDGASISEGAWDLDADLDGDAADLGDVHQAEEGAEVKSEVRRESLSNYIHPQSAAVLHAYRTAVHAIRFPEVHNPQAEQKPREACAGEVWVRAGDVAKVMGYLGSRARQRGDKTPIQHHNDYVLYVSAMFVVMVGHRRARTLLPFLHDLSLKEAIAFIADKMREGSEARFVPLIDLLIEQFQAYLAHVLFFEAELGRTNGALAKTIRVAIGLSPVGKDQEPVRQTGPLFRIRGKRAIPVTTVAVDAAIREAMHALGLGESARIEVRALRRNVATWLADEGVSGSQIEMLLGHVRQLHPFGPTSVWIPLEAFDPLRSHLRRYADEMGCKVVTAPWAWAFTGRMSVPLPAFERSSLAYEGRQLEADEAKLRARKAVLDAVPESVLLDEQAVDLDESDIERIETAIRAGYPRRAMASAGHEHDPDMIIEQLREMAKSWRKEEGYAAPRSELLRPVPPTELAYADDEARIATINAVRRVALRVLKKSQVQGHRVILMDEATVKKLLVEIETELQGDPAARAKVKVAFAELADSWRRTGKYRVTAATLNLTRFAAGPVGVSYSRHLALANAVVDGLPGRIKSFLGRGEIQKGAADKDDGVKKRLGLIATLLVTCEAVLDLRELEGIMDALQTDGLKRFEGQMQVRASISTSEAEYDRTADLTYKTAVAIGGYLKFRGAAKPLPFAEVEAAANSFLKHVIAPISTMNLRRLMVVMRPYWFLRMPGSVFATVSGSQECNAPSAASTQLLLGGEPPALSIVPPSPRAPILKRTAAIETALAHVAELVNQAEGEIPKFQGASRQQRLRLRQQFSGRHRPELEAWMQRVQVVELAVEFIYYMLEVGGFRVQTYSFGSLQTYRRRVLRQIFEVAWNADLVKMSADELSVFFRAVIQKIDVDQRQLAKAPLRLFLRFLHQWHGAVNTRYDADTLPRLRLARNVVIPTALAEKAIQRAKEPDGKASQVAKASATLLALDHAFGLRPSESYGLKVTDFADDSLSSVWVRLNVIRSLKTLQRKVPVSLGGEGASELLEARAKVASQRGRDTDFALFTLEDRTELFDDVQLYAIGNWAIKQVTGDPEAVAYSLRHTYATSVMTRMLLHDPRASAIAVQVSVSLMLPGGAQNQLERLQLGPDRWPHQIDRLGAWMGHNGHKTLSHTYWHGAWWVAGEVCAREALRNPWESDVVGELLGVSGAAVRGRFPKREDGRRLKEGARTAAAIEEVVKSSAIAPLLVVIADRTEANSKAESSRVRPVLSVLDAMLMQRRLGKEDFEVLPAAASERVKVPLADAQRFYDAYEHVGSITSMLDFEPDASRPGALRDMDVGAGADRRDELLAVILARLSSDKEFVQATSDVLAEWQQEVDGDAEVTWLVSRTVDRFRLQVKWLMTLGYDPALMQGRYFSASPDQVDEATRLIPTIAASDRRLSRTSKIGQRQEFALLVKDPRRLPEKRDFHRVLLALVCAREAKLLGLQE